MRKIKTNWKLFCELLRHLSLAKFAITPCSKTLCVYWCFGCLQVCEANSFQNVCVCTVIHGLVFLNLGYFLHTILIKTTELIKNSIKTKHFKTRKNKQKLNWNKNKKWNKKYDLIRKFKTIIILHQPDCIMYYSLRQICDCRLIANTHTPTVLRKKCICLAFTEQPRLLQAARTVP